MNYVNNTISSGQQKDCTIRALASLCNVSYQTAELTLALAGKSENKGFDIYTWIDDNKGRILGCQFTLTRGHQKVGRFLLGNKRHVMALIDNVIHDAGSRGMRYIWCYKVELNAGADETTKLLDKLKSKGVHTLAEWIPMRQKIINSI